MVYTLLEGSHGGPNSTANTTVRPHSLTSGPQIRAFQELTFNNQKLPFRPPRRSPNLTFTSQKRHVGPQRFLKLYFYTARKILWSPSASPHTKDAPRDPQGTPKGPQGTPKGLPGTPRDSQGSQGTSKGPPQVPFAAIAGNTTKTNGLERS